MIEAIAQTVMRHLEDGEEERAYNYLTSVAEDPKTPSLVLEVARRWVRYLEDGEPERVYSEAEDFADLTSQRY